MFQTQLHKPQTRHYKRLTRLFLAGFLIIHGSCLLAQDPGNGNLNGKPPVNESTNVTNNGATLIQANADGSATYPNEFLYFKVRGLGVDNPNNNDWYASPSAWMDPSMFHFKNLSLHMYNNTIKLRPGAFIDFAADWAKQPNAATIVYSATPGNGLGAGLNIVGGNTTPVSLAVGDRQLCFLADKGSLFLGKVNVVQPGNVTFEPPTKLPSGADLANYMLYVDGGILAKEVRVNTKWADYVFAPDYRLRPLAEVEAHIQQRGHLPGMPTGEEVGMDGISVGEMARLQQEKIEELTLYVIGLKKEVEQLKAALTPNATTK